jgi:hypothetical protein
MCVDRYFTAFDAERVDELGFLDRERSPRLFSCDDLLSEPIAWILGRPWIGKSTVAAGLYNHVRNDLTLLPGLDGRITLTLLASPDASRDTPPPWWNEWILDEDPKPAIWLIDGVDETLDHDHHLLQRIISTLETTPIGHLRCLRLLLFSRPYTELTEFRQSLQTFYTGITQHTQICQYWLTKVDRTAAASLVGVDRFAAVEELIRNNRLQPVAGYPVVLSFLKKYRETAKLSIPDVWRGVLMALLGERRTNTAVRFEAEQSDRLHAACRIAAVLTLTGRDSIRHWSPDPSEPTLDMLFQAPVGSQLAASREVCTSALFTDADTETVRFVQRNAQDWLTAFAFASLPLLKLRSALSASDGKLAPRLKEITRLIREVRTGHADQALIDQLSGGTLLPSDAVEPSMGQVIRDLDHLEALAIAAPWGLSIGYQRPEELMRLRVEGLGGILAERLRDPKRLPRVKELLIDIAEATHSVEAVEAAISLVLDPSQDDELKYSATLMVTRLGGREHLSALEIPIGEATGTSEIECRVRGLLIRELLNRGMWPVWRAAIHLPSPVRGLLDSRRIVLQHIEQSITLPDARHLLPHLQELHDRHADDYEPHHHLPNYLLRAVELVLSESPPDPRDIDTLLNFVTSATATEFGWSAVRDIIQQLRQFPIARRRLYQHDIEMIAAGTPTRQLLAWQLLLPDDWQWVRDQALGVWAGNREVWTQAHWLAFRAREAGRIPEDQWNSFVALVEEHAPGLIAEFHESGRRFQQEKAQREAADRQRETCDSRRLPLAERVQSLLARTELSPTQLMIELSWNCFTNFLPGQSEVENAWIDLSPELRSTVLNAFCRGLETAEPTPITNVGSFSGRILAEGAAFMQIIGSADHTAWLTDGMIRRWLPTALFARMSGDWAGPITACNLISPTATEAALLCTIEIHVRRDTEPFVLRQIPAGAWTNAMTDRFVELLSDESISPRGRRELIEQLTVRALDRAEPFISCWARHSFASDPTDQLRQAGRNLLLFRDPAEALNMIESDFATRGAAALEELPILWRDQEGPAVRIEQWQFPLRERLSRLLFRAYPFTTDQEFQDGAVTPDRELRWIRDRLFSDLLQRTQTEFVEAVDRLAETDPAIRTRVENHRANQRAVEFLPGIDPSAARDPNAMSVQDAIQLLDRAGFRLIRTADDLFEATLEALNAINSTVGHDVSLLYFPSDGTDVRKHLHEDSLQAYLRRRLIDELSRLAERVEVQIVREDQVANRQRLDLRVLAPCHGGNGMAQVVVEVKWSTNDETRVGLVDQLGNRYLLGETLTHGIFLVGWSGEWWPRDGTGRSTDLHSLINYLSTQRDDYCKAGQPGVALRIEPFVLDARWARSGN